MIFSSADTQSCRNTSLFALEDSKAALSIYIVRQTVDKKRSDGAEAAGIAGHLIESFDRYRKSDWQTDQQSKDCST